MGVAMFTGPGTCYHTDEEVSLMARTLELPDEVYAALARAAQDSGTTTSEWIARRLPGSGDGQGRPTAAEIATANARLRATIVDLGHASGTDNEAIDADLAREYGDDHAALSSRGR